MSTENISRKKVITKVIVGVFLTLAVFGFVFADIQNYVPSYNNPTIRTVNGYEISQSDLKQERDGLRQQMQMGFQDPLIQQQLIYRALDNLTLRAALLSYAEDLGIKASNQEIANILKSISAFQGPDGEFDKIKLKKTLQSQGVTVNQFQKNLSKGIVQEKITTPITADFPLTDQMANIINGLAFTEIKLDSYALTFKELPKAYQETTLPTDVQLQQLYTEKKETLIRPNLKNIDYVIYDAENLKDKITLADNAAQEYYDKNQKTLYFTPQKWKVLQIIFDDQEQANKGYDTLMDSTNFKTAAKDMGYELDDIDLGYITPKELTVTDNTDHIFSRAVGETTKPIETDFGYAIYFIEAIQPETITPFENVKQEIIDTLYTQKITNYLSDISLKIEDDLAGGAEFSEITQNYGSKIVSVTNITPSGIIYGSDIDDAFSDQIPMEYVTDYDTGDEIPVIQLENNAFALMKITASEPARPLSFDEAKADLIAQDIKAQQNAILTQIISKLKTTDDRSSLIAEYKIEPKEYTLKRNDYIPQDIYREGFDGIIYADKIGETFSDITDQDAILVVIKNISTPSELPETEAQDFTARLQKNFGSYIQQQALDMLSSKAKIETNDTALSSFMLKEIEG